MFLSFTDAGSQFVFGDNYTDHFFVFRVWQQHNITNTSIFGTLLIVEACDLFDHFLFLIFCFSWHLIFTTGLGFGVFNLI